MELGHGELLDAGIGVRRKPGAGKGRVDAASGGHVSSVPAAGESPDLRTHGTPRHTGMSYPYGLSIINGAANLNVADCSSSGVLTSSAKSWKPRCRMKRSGNFTERNEN